ncbi:hypothetical protein BC834DRAFT_529836 [Gloeopeniophorella convolvens]|nr:hypothetical protein BC834DRAFT_529836 [Gloeopeniophorella convolvens]
MRATRKVLPFVLALTVALSFSPWSSLVRTATSSPAQHSLQAWDSPPSPDSTDHLIFNSVAGLLQRWPNTLRRNGHSIVPAIIPAGTTIYHGRNTEHIPSASEWFAFDFEHAYVFCRGPCYMVTLKAKRDLRLLHFDGASAAKMNDGPLDSQDVISWGRPQPEKWLAEHERLAALCDWGRRFGLDGFVRMEFDFEVMLCNVLDGTEVVSILDLPSKNMTGTIIGSREERDEAAPSSPLPPGPPWPVPAHMPINWQGSLLSWSTASFEAYAAASWHDHAPGETRVRVDYTGFVTFFDSSLRSLVEARRGKDRIRHRLEGISETDANQVRAELETVLSRRWGSDSGNSGTNWASVTRNMVDRYSGRLNQLRFLLSPEAPSSSVVQKATAVRTQLLIMLTPYLSATEVPSYLSGGSDRSWAAPIMRRCASTQWLYAPPNSLTKQETRIHEAIEGTLREICRRLVLTWADTFDVENTGNERAAEVIQVGRRNIDELTSWLDWPAWVRCEHGCASGEICYIPSWPFLDGEDPYDMTPRCLSRGHNIHL